ncbi:TolC family protein [Pseudomonadales bacterium]|nr:TolC family protein [Pseudomonadales bacterium]MDB4420788.1 TolC family protein [Pseudomonadales bacterium]
MQLQKTIAAVCLIMACLSSGISVAEPTVQVETEKSLTNAASSNSLDLEDAISHTLENNPQLFQYRFRKKSLLAHRETQSYAPPLHIGLETENVAGSGAFNGFDSAETTLSLSSVIELGGKARSRVAVIDAKTDRLSFEQQAATLDVLGELTTLYISCLSTQESIRLAEETVGLSERMLSTVKRRAAKGAAPDAEVMRAKAALSRSKIRLRALYSSYDRQKVMLSSFWGENDPKFDALKGRLSVFESEADFPSLFKRAQNSPAIAILASEARLRDAEVKLAKAQSRVNIGWQLGVRRYEDTNDTALTAGITIPLFNGKRNRGSVISALAERDALEYQKKDALSKLHTRLYAAFSQWEENTRVVNQMSSQVLPALEKALILTRQAYEAGRYRYQDWIVAQEELLAAKQQRIEAATSAQLSQALIEQLVAEPLKTNKIIY